MHYLTGIILLFTTVACAKQAPPPAHPGEEELRLLKLENGELVARVNELQNERDRLRKKLEQNALEARTSTSSPEQLRAERTADQDGSEGDTSGDSPSPALPVVKLYPTPSATSAQQEEDGVEESRPILRAYGEEEGKIIHATEKPVGRKP